ncbi:hypothetical protein [Zymobacter palmae]|uniref:hypothetical protein n=1 Tax=Zymobacter palmae TaxID=33074 RepID=UPI0011AE437F|nr:hypothetical protein [Zymobacter palmae]
MALTRALVVALGIKTPIVATICQHRAQNKPIKEISFKNTPTTKTICSKSKKQKHKMPLQKIRIHTALRPCMKAPLWAAHTL